MKIKTINKCLLVIALLAFAVVLGLSNYSIVAKANSATNASELYSTLEKLRNGSIARETIINIGSSEDIDFNAYEYVPINLASDIYEEKDITIVFSGAVKNVYHKTLEIYVDNTPNYGLFSNVETGYIPVYYKVNFEVGEGTLNGALTQYKYGKATSLPSVTPKEGDTFIKWVLKGDESETAVTGISTSDWGVKTFVAVYETNVVEPEPDPEPIPVTYDIVYEDSLLGSDISSLKRNYTEGVALTLETLSQAGFVFKGWQEENTASIVKELETTIPSDYISDDGKIHLSAVWELENISSVSIVGINKIYDGIENIVEPQITHTILNELDLVYTWYKADSEQDKQNASEFSNDSRLSFVEPCESYYYVSIKARHFVSGLETDITASEWVKVKIEKAPLTIVALPNAVVEKEYDGGVSAINFVAQGRHYTFNGLIGSDQAIANISSATYASKDAGDSVVTIVFSTPSFDSDEIANHYSYTPTSIEISGNISPKEIWLNKLTTYVITKDYDGTTGVDYDFVEDRDYAINGLVDDLSYEKSASYKDKNAGESNVTFSIAFNSNNYFIATREIIFNGKINARTITPKSISSPLISKVYDGTRNVTYSFEMGKDYLLEGTVEDEIVGVNTFASYDRLDVNATTVCLLFSDIQYGEYTNPDNYIYEKDYYEFNYSASITHCEIKVSPFSAQKVYGESEDLTEAIATGIGSEEIVVEYLRDSGERVGEYNYYGAKIISNSPCYNLFYVGNENKFKIIPAVPNLVFPVFKGADYNPDNALFDMTLDCEGYNVVGTRYQTSLGEFYWLNEGAIPSVNNKYYIMVFVPNDKHNYDYTSLDGYTSDGEIVMRNVYLDIAPIDPIPTDVNNELTLAVGTFWSKVIIGNGWSIESDLIDLSGVVRGEIGQSVTYTNALKYTHDDTGNYNLLYEDLTIHYIRPVIKYSYNGETISSVSQTAINSALNGKIEVSFVLENPFEKVGYKVDKWSGTNFEIIATEDLSVGDTYVLEDANLIEKEICLAITFKAREDIKITFNHYYENIQGEFSEEDLEVIERKDGVADTIRAIEESDVISREGFNFIGCKMGNGSDYITEFNVLPSGESVINFYYERKNVTINYHDDKYYNLPHSGTLPQGASVKYGATINLSSPIEYMVYGYSFVGYTDGLTYEGSVLKIYNSEYLVKDDVASITFNLVLSANEDTGYLVKTYLDGIESVDMRYGTTGEKVDITQEKRIGYERVTHEEEILEGIISGYIIDANGDICGGNMLELKIYFVTKYFKIEIKGELNIDDFEAREGETITLPNAPENSPEGNQFVGWEIDGKLYMAGEKFVMPANQVTITPVWEKVIEDLPNDEENLPGEELPEGNEGVEEPSVEEEKSTLGVGGIVGITLGGVAVLSALLGISITVSRKNKERAMIIGKMEARKNRK